MLITVIAGESRPVTCAQVLVFATGADRVPPLGFPLDPTLEFIHDAGRPSDRLLPTAITFSRVLRLPVHSSYASE